MKTKKLVIWVLTALLLCSMVVTVCAAGQGTKAQLSYVTDTANLLGAGEKTQLENRAAAISEKYGLGVYIIAVDDYRKYSSHSEIFDSCVEIYEKYTLGWGEDQAGTVLMISMDDRDYTLDFNSERADYAFTEAGRDKMENRILPYFRNNDYYGGFSEYLNCCEEYLEAASQGSPVGEGERSSADEKGGLGALVALPGVIISAITGMVVTAPMKSTGLKHEANDYAVPGSLHIVGQSDMFTHRTVTRQRKESSSSGGSSHHSSGSHSGRSGKF